MAQHNDMSDRELAGWLESLAPRRSAIDRERLLYEAGRAAAQSEHQRWRRVSLAAMASGWLAAAVLLGMSWTKSDPLVAAGGALKNTPADTDVVVEPVIAESGNQAVEHRRDAGDVSANPSVPHPGVSSQWDVTGTGPSLTGEGMLRTADLRRVSRTGRLSSDRPAGTSAAEGPGPVVESPLTYFEMRRAISRDADLL
jgi:hypothetical protein